MGGFAKQSLARRIPKQSLGTTGDRGGGGRSGRGCNPRPARRGAKRRFAGRIPKRRLGTTRWVLAAEEFVYFFGDAY